MRDERLDAAKAYLRKSGIDDIPDEVLLGLFASIKDKQSAIYEQGDFVLINFGMGEAGHGKILAASPNNQTYSIDVWAPGRRNRVGIGAPWVTEIAASDIIKLSTPKSAYEYYQIRSKSEVNSGSTE